MRRATQILAAACLLVVPALARGTGGDESTAVIDKAIKAHFPKGLDTKNKGVRTKSKGMLHISGLDLEFTQEVTAQGASKFKEVMQLTVMNKNVMVTTVFNGKEGWIRADDKDIKVTAEILDEFKQVAYSMGLVQGFFLKDKALKFMAVGESQVKGKAALGVRVSRDGKRDVTLYFDKGTGLLAKVDQRKRDIMSGQEVNEERYITEYQDVGGRKVAKKIEVQRDGAALLEAEVTEVQIVPGFDDAEFVEPK
jgi:hypothetical protein